MFVLALILAIASVVVGMVISTIQYQFIAVKQPKFDKDYLWKQLH